MNESLTVAEKVTLAVVFAVLLVVILVSWHVHQASLAEIANSDYGFWPPLPATEQLDVATEQSAISP